MIALLLTAEGRRAAAFLAALCGCAVLTMFAAIGVFLVRGHVTYSFWLAIAAHVQIGVVLTGFIAMFVKRHIKVSRDGVEVSDTGDSPSLAVTTETEERA